MEEVLNTSKSPLLIREGQRNQPSSAVYGSRRWQEFIQRQKEQKEMNLRIDENKMAASASANKQKISPLRLNEGQNQIQSHYYSTTLDDLDHQSHQQKFNRSLSWRKPPNKKVIENESSATNFSSLDRRNLSGSANGLRRSLREVRCNEIVSTMPRNFTTSYDKKMQQGRNNNFADNSELIQSSHYYSSPPEVKDRLQMPERKISTVSQISNCSSVPPAIKELESIYAPMKSLLEPLPRGSRDDDLNSEVGSVVAINMPPPLPLLQSHAFLENRNLNGSTPKSTSKMWNTNRLFESQSSPKTVLSPPIPPRCGNGERPNRLDLNNTSSTSSSGVYANSSKFTNRTSLMSTGSSETASNQSSSSSMDSQTGAPSGVPSSCAGASFKSNSSFKTASSPATPTSPPLFNWVMYNNGKQRQQEDEILEIDSDFPPSVSQRPSPSGQQQQASSSLGDLSRNNDHGSLDLVQTHGDTPVDATAHYMNVMYNVMKRNSSNSPTITQQQANQYANVSLESAANIYYNVAMAASANRLKSTKSRRPSNDEGLTRSRLRSSSASRLHDLLMSSKLRLQKSNSSRPSKPSASDKARAILEFKKLMKQVEEKRFYRVGLNLFNTKPELGVEYLARKGFLQMNPESVARFLHRKNAGLSKEKVGEYLGDLRSPFSSEVLGHFIRRLDFADLRIDKALRRLFLFLRPPGEAQQIERIVEAFGGRYKECNGDLESYDASSLAFALILLNTDLHSFAATDKKSKMKAMTCDEFVSNLKGVNGGGNYDKGHLKAVYKAVKKRQFAAGADHVAQTRALQSALLNVPKSFHLAENHRRLVCLCRLREGDSDDGKGRGDATRNVLLFNDLLVITTKKSSKEEAYVFRDSYSLIDDPDLGLSLFSTSNRPYGVALTSGGKAFLTLDADSDQDRFKFVMDLQESIFEMNLTRKELEIPNYEA